MSKTFITICIISVFALSSCLVVTDQLLQGKSLLNKFAMDGTSSDESIFEMWCQLYSKGNLMGTQKFENFKSNLAQVREVNSQNLSYFFELNQFSDLTNEEFTTMYLQKLNTEESNTRFLKSHEKKDTESSGPFEPIDHRAALNPPRDQGQCGGCWAFSVLGSIEGTIGVKSGKKLDYLSTQQLLDCDKVDSGCNGGDFQPFYKYLLGGDKKISLEFDKEYPYLAREGRCQWKDQPTNVKVANYDYCSNKRENTCSHQRAYELLQQGTPAVAIDGSAIQMYGGGVFTGRCRSDNHAVVAVGYGTTEVKGSTVEYTLIRNSWGRGWGEEGHIKVAYNESNKSSCFTENEVYLPLF